MFLDMMPTQVDIYIDPSLPTQDNHCRTPWAFDV